jgi:hypothetical protein
LQPRGLDGWIVPDKSGFHEDILSDVTTDLPSKKSFVRSGTLLADQETQRFIDSAAVPAQNWPRFHGRRLPPSPEIYHPSG